MLGEAIDRLLGERCTPAQVRDIESGGSADTLWAAIDGSGFADALVAESRGGAGLALRDVFEVLVACGRHALPLPLGQTMLVRAALAEAHADVPRGALALAEARFDADGGVSAAAVPFGRVADAVLVFDGDTGWLLPVAAAERVPSGVHGSLQARLRWPRRPAEAVALGAPWLHIGALLSAALMAGALQRVLELTLTHANDRVQFGKPIGKFQAVQQQLAVLAEQVFAARMAAQLGCASAAWVPQPALAALAKARAGEATERAAAIAHAVHGAIGITAEHDLQLYTRRLQEWRGDFRATPFWHAQLGRQLLDAGATLPFLLERLAPAAQGDER